MSVCLHMYLSVCLAAPRATVGFIRRLVHPVKSLLVLAPPCGCTAKGH